MLLVCFPIVACTYAGRLVETARIEVARSSARARRIEELDHRRIHGIVTTIKLGVECLAGPIVKRHVEHGMLLIYRPGIEVEPGRRRVLSDGRQLGKQLLNDKCCRDRCGHYAL